MQLNIHIILAIPFCPEPICPCIFMIFCFQMACDYQDFGHLQAYICIYLFNLVILVRFSGLALVTYGPSSSPFWTLKSLSLQI